MKRFKTCFHFLCLALSLVCLPANSAVLAVDDHNCAEMKTRRVLKDNPPVHCNQLSIVRFSYVDFEGRTHHDGEIMVLTAVAKQVENIFNRLHEARFPIAKARLMHHYQGSDEASMQDNNTSAFNHRSMTGGTLPSLHAYGLAIDLNPVQNPYIHFHQEGTARYQPAAGSRYANRLKLRPGKAPGRGMAEEAVRIFADNGFLVWGGHWDNPIDYQHFQVSRKLAEHLVALPPQQGQVLFSRHVDDYRTCMRKNSAQPGSLSRMRCAAKYAD